VRVTLERGRGLDADAMLAALAEAADKIRSEAVVRGDAA
jgi:hypothetical protein